MNERIRELAEQAYNEQNPELLTNASRTFEHGVWLSGYSKKFAELIVRECASMARVYHSHEYDFTGDLELDEFMLKHFGVEE